MTDDRAQELSGRWGESSDETDTAMEAGEQADNQTDEQAANSNSRIDDQDEQANRRKDDTGEQTNQRKKLTTRERESQMVYLWPDQYERIHGAWLDLEYRFGRKRGIDLEKSRDFLVPLLELGLAQLGDVETRELDELADRLDIEHE